MPIGKLNPGLLRRAIAALRYRFFLLAAALPYALGAAAGASAGALHWPLFWIGLGGLVSVSAGVEGMNEYFDSVLGSDKVFERQPSGPPAWSLPAGVGGFALGLAAAVHLTWVRGWPVFAFALLGAAAAFCYLGPPLRFSYRGLGELTIAAAYGPGVTLGAYYLQAGRLAPRPAALSLVPALLLLALAIANEVPDYHADRLVGKRNLVVRMGRRRAVRLFAIVLACAFGLIGALVALGLLPPLALLGLLALPLAGLAIARARKSSRDVARFIPALRASVWAFLLVHAALIGSLLFG